MNKKGLGFNVIFQTIYQLFLTITPLITTPYVSRMLGVNGVGTYSYTLSMCKYFMLFALLGVEDYGCRSIASVNGNKEAVSKNFVNIFCFQIITSVIAIITYFGYCFFLVKTDLIVALLQGMMVISCLFDISWFFYGIEELKAPVFKGTLLKILTMVLTFVLVNKNTGVIAYTIAMAGGTLISQGVLWIYIKKEITIVKPSFSEILRHGKANFILFIPVVAQTVFQVMDKSMLGWLSTKAESGYYYNTDMIIYVPVGIIGGLSTVFLARLSSLYAENNREEINKVLLESFELYSCIACPLTFGISAVANEFIPLFFGESFAPCIQLTYLLCPAIILKTYSTLLKTEVFIPSHRENYFTFSVVVAAIINVVLNTLLIPGYGAAGAVIGTIGAEFSELLILAFGFLKIDTTVSKKKILTNIVYYIFALIMLLAVRQVSKWMVSSSVFSVILIEILVGIFTYSLLCLLFWKKSKSQIGIAVKSILKR